VRSPPSSGAFSWVLVLQADESCETSDAAILDELVLTHALYIAPPLVPAAIQTQPHVSYDVVASPLGRPQGSQEEEDGRDRNGRVQPRSPLFISSQPCASCPVLVVCATLPSRRLLPIPLANGMSLQHACATTMRNNHATFSPFWY